MTWPVSMFLKRKTCGAKSFVLSQKAFLNLVAMTVAVTVAGCSVRSGSSLFPLLPAAESCLTCSIFNIHGVHWPFSHFLIFAFSHFRIF